MASATKVKKVTKSTKSLAKKNGVGTNGQTKQVVKDIEQTHGGNLHKLWCQFPISDGDQGIVDSRLKALGISTYGAYARLLMAKDSSFKF